MSCVVSLKSCFECHVSCVSIRLITYPRLSHISMKVHAATTSKGSKREPTRICVPQRPETSNLTLMCYPMCYHSVVTTLPERGDSDNGSYPPARK